MHAGPYVDIVVGGHSHTLLFNGEPPENSGFVPRGPYPIVVEQETRSVSLKCFYYKITYMFQIGIVCILICKDSLNFMNLGNYLFR